LAEDIRRVGSTPSIIVIVPLRSIIDEQLRSNDFALRMVAFGNNSAVLSGINENNFQIVYASAEEALSPEFVAVLKNKSSPFRKELSLIVVDECHTVNTW
jgi:superfamily II DNA helicase RecQ